MRKRTFQFYYVNFLFFCLPEQQNLYYSQNLPCLCAFQIMLMSTPILREENALNSSNVAMFQGHPCFREPCQNGGRCNPQLERYECSCPTGFSGENCQNSEYCYLPICSHNACPFMLQDNKTRGSLSFKTRLFSVFKGYYII